LGDYRIIGIDPGVNGGVASIDIIAEEAIPGSIKLYRMPKGDREERAVGIADLICSLNPSVTIIERVQGFHGGRSTPVTSFVMGESFGHLTGVASAVGSKLIYITPQTWVKHIGMKRDRDKSQGQWKASLKEAAIKLFPKVEGITLYTCDALLILKVGLEKKLDIKI